LDDISTFDKQRIIKDLGKLSRHEIKRSKQFLMRLSLINLEKATANGTMLREYLKGVEAEMINTFAGAALKMMKMLRKIWESVICDLNKLIEKVFRNYQVLINCC